MPVSQVNSHPSVAGLYFQGCLGYRVSSKASLSELVTLSLKNETKPAWVGRLRLMLRGREAVAPPPAQPDGDKAWLLKVVVVF